MGLSPMMQHYLQMKEKHKDCILMYRLGDFYEMFFEDAITASKALDLTLTGRQCGLEERAPMCGVPYHALDNYLAKLIEQGYKVAICEQLSEPTKGAMVDRDVVRVVTAGTLTEADLLDEKANNYIAAIFLDEEAQSIGLAYTDITTGECNLNQFDRNAFVKLSDALARILPAEIICNEPMLAYSYDLMCVKAGITPRFSVYRADAWEYSQSAQAVKGLLDGVDFDARKNAVCAAGALLSYIGDTQMQKAENIARIDVERDDEYMYLDLITRRNLELTTTMRDRKDKKGTLLSVLDKTSTAMGRRNLVRWIEKPLRSVSVLQTRLDSVAELFDRSDVRLRLINALKKLNDIERLSAKVSYRSVGPRDLDSLRVSLLALPEIVEECSQLASDGIVGSLAEVDLMSDVCELIDSALALDKLPVAIHDGGFVREGYNAELDSIRKIKQDSQAWLAALEASEKEETGIKTLKVGYNRVFGYYIEVSKSQIPLVPYRYQRKQTLTTGERYITEELKQLEEKILGGTERAIKIEIEIFEKLCEVVRAAVPRIQKTAQALANIDCLVSLAEVAAQNGYVRPELADDGVIEIKDGRHPVLEKGEALFVPNNCSMNGDEDRIMLITGPNMAGKSTYMRQVALIAIMAHIGSFVPAKSAHICMIDRVFTRIGASDDLMSGQSTFMVEMLEVANILDNATPKSLLLLDEIGRGTSTYDGLSIAWAVIEYLSQSLRAKTLFSTHYHELTELEQRLDGIKNYRITVKEMPNTIIFLHKIARGSAMRSFGIEVAQLAGVKADVVSRAKKVLANLKTNAINDGVADKVLPAKQTSLFEAVSLKGYSEVKDIVNDLDFNSMTPLKAFEILQDVAERLKDNG